MNMMYLEKFISDYREKTRFSGIVRVRQNDKLIFSGDYGLASIEKAVPFDEKSMFSLYSMSKPFCAIGLMKLWDKGLLSLDDHPKKYIPEMESFHKDLTVRQMLWHIAGVPDFEQSGAFSDYCKDRLYEDLKKIGEMEQREPGKYNFYANINYIVPALIIEKLSGLPYKDYMRKEVFEPLNMTAVIDEVGVEIPNRVTGYEIRDDKIVAVDRATSYLLGAGDIVGTESDALKLMYLVRDKLLLSEKAWAEIFKYNSVNGMGLGCNKTPWHSRPCITHNGGHTGFRTFHKYLFDEDLDVIILSNSGWGNARPDISEAVYQSIFGEAEAETALELDKGYATK